MTESDRLETYRSKRDFDRTAEPSGEAAPATWSTSGEPRFVVQKHAARRLHYDVRFEAEGVLISWAVPKGPSYDPGVKRLAVHVEDHPLDYAAFEGTIGQGEYGAGAVIVWDEGTYRNATKKRGREVSVVDGVASGHLSVWLEGTKLRGGWSLTRTGRSGRQEAWIMVKRNDEHADRERDITADEPDSVLTHRSIEQVKGDPTARTWTGSRATWQPPMLAQALQLPAEARALSGPGWSYERKLDGLRCLAVRNGPEVELWSRNHLSFLGRFPQIADAVAAVPADNFTIDGEVVAFEGGRTSFALLQGRGHDGAPAPEYHAFDLLQLLGRDTTVLPLEDRRSLLAQTLADAPPPIHIVESFDGDPAALLARSCDQGWEGLIAKRVGSTYRPGRSTDWRKLKCSASQELVVGGWTDPSGTRTGFGALLLGYYEDDGRFRFAGKVGTGFDHAELVELKRTLDAMAVEESPFDDRVRVKGAHWARPEMVVAVAFTEWTADGMLRHPRFEAVRTDKDARDVRRELR